MKKINRFVVAACVTFSLFTVSCTLEKRHYRNGFYFDSFFSPDVKHDQQRTDSSTAIVSTANNSICHSLVEEAVIDSAVPDVLLNKPIHIPEFVKDTLPLLTIWSAPPFQFHFHRKTQKDEPLLNYDKPNATIRNIMLLAIGCVLLYLLFQFVGPPMLIASLVPLLPGLGALLFAMGIFMRSWVKKLLKNGVHGPQLRLSPHFQKFIFPLTVLFLAAAAFTLLYLLGPAVIVGEGTLLVLNVARAVMFLAPVELGIFSLIYYFYWRKMVV